MVEPSVILDHHVIRRCSWCQQDFVRHCWRFLSQGHITDKLHFKFSIYWIFYSLIVRYCKNLRIISWILFRCTCNSYLNFILNVRGSNWEPRKVWLNEAETVSCCSSCAELEESTLCASYQACIDLKNFSCLARTAEALRMRNFFSCFVILPATCGRSVIEVRMAVESASLYHSFPSIVRKIFDVSKRVNISWPRLLHREIDRLVKFLLSIRTIGGFHCGRDLWVRKHLKSK